MDKRVFRLISPAVRQRAIDAIWGAPDEAVCTIAEPTRNGEQNARMWAMLGDVSKQVEWYGKRLTPEDWKHVFSAGIRKLEVVPNLDGTGFVALGMSTSSMSKREMSDLIELMFAFGSEREIAWSESEVRC